MIADLSGVAIVMVHPKYPENIGAAARIACNFGISELIVVSSKGYDQAAMAKMATHKARHIVEGISYYDSLAEAVGRFSIIVGTTARSGRQRSTEKSPRDIIERIGPDLAANRTAFLFGREDSGLTNDELKYCHYNSSIPTADFSSLNLAQAVAIHCHELYYHLIHTPKRSAKGPKLASSFELEGMYSHVEAALTEINFLEETNHRYWMTSIRKFFSRIRLTSKDSQIIRGICRQFIGYQRQRRKQ
ncbi:MAG: tRNA methyltransferase [Deltaproteobacteria bacterium]|nr:MAG: tRNA methyltransferase [Deltaproteobacteria bacterium]